MNRTKRINQILKKNLIEYQIKVIDDSFSHLGHNNFDGKSETHVIIELKKKLDKKINRLDIHRKINLLLREEFDTGLHSLQIKIT